MASEPVQELPTITPQTLVGVNLYPQQRLVEIKTRAYLAISDQSAVISYDIVEGLFATLLSLRLAERGQHVALAPMGEPAKPH